MPAHKKKNIILPKLEEHQQIVYDAIKDSRGTNKTFVIKSPRQRGKTALTIIILIKFALEKKCVSGMLQPTLNQSRRVFKDLTSMLEGSGCIKSANAQTLEIEFVNGSSIFFKSSEQRESLRGYTVSGILIIDECAFIPQEIIDIINPWTNVHRAPTLITSTPLFQDSYFFEAFQNPQNQAFDWSKYRCERFISDEQIEEYRRKMSSLKFKTEILGEFITDGSYVFGDIYSCITNYSPSPAVYLGIDWATGDGGDYTWLTFLDEQKRVTALTYFNDKSPTEQVSIISRIINQTPTLKKVTVEQNSIGNVYFDFLKQAINKKSIIESFNTSNESKRRIIEQLATAFQNGEITIPNDNELISQLQHYAMEKTPSGKITYNGVGGYHDDAVMSLAIAYDMTVVSQGDYTVTFTRKKRKISMAEKYG